MKIKRKAERLMEEIQKIDDYDELRKIVANSNCHCCFLYEARTNIVFDRGINHGALVIGECPGEREDLLGKPFVGKSGELLDDMFEEAGIDVEKLVVSNTCKCRPDGNRTPTDKEIVECSPIIVRQIQLLKPKIILFLGKTALRCSLRAEHIWVAGSIMQWVGYGVRDLFLEQHVRPEFWNVESMATYHPAYILRNKSERKYWVSIAREFLKKCRKLKLSIEE